MDLAVKVGIYTALYGEYDTLKPLNQGQTGHLFTDQQHGAGVEYVDGWRVVYRPHQVVTRHGDAALLAPMLAHKYWKCHPDKAFPDVDVSVWVDASITLADGFVGRALTALAEDDWVSIPHPWRTCIYDEAAYSATLPRYRSLAADIKRQAAWYKELGHPAEWGLPASGLLVRRHTPEVLEMSHHWWMECLNWTHQDQISLPVLQRMYADRIKFNHNIGWEDGWQLGHHLK